MQSPTSSTPTLVSSTANGVPHGVDVVDCGHFRQATADGYRHCLRRPVAIITVVLALCGLAVSYAQRFAFDASTDTLIAEHDPELAYFQRMVETFGESSFLVLTYTPVEGPLLVPRHIERLSTLERDLLELPGIAGVTSILDAPLLRSPPVSLTALGTDYNTLRNASVDLGLAEKELTTSPLFKELLISADGRTTVLRIDLNENAELAQARKRRDALSARLNPTRADEAAYAGAVKRYNGLYETHKAERAAVIRAVRAVREKYMGDATLYLGGVPMVASDMIDFVKNDIMVFGIAVLLLITVALYTFFRRLRWVLIPLGTTSVTVLLLVGLLGFLEQPVTAISSNFIALIAIITISFTIHLIVRYMELRHAGFSDDHTELVFETMRSKLAPCVYTALTTIVAFASLLTSDIVPVVDFGWIMCVGILISLLVTYSFFASVLVLLPKGRASTQLGRTPKLTTWFARMAIERSNRLLVVALLAALAAAYGVTQVSLDNRFIEYFRSGTEIREGMTFIDRTLGGTIPLDIIIKFPPFEPVVADPGDFDDFGAAEDPFPSRYWFTPQKLNVLERFEKYLDTRPEVGKSVSLTNLEQIARYFNEGEPLDHLQLVGVLSVLPPDIRQRLVDPYASPESGELRIATRIHETGPPFSRQALIDDIYRFASEELELGRDAVRVTGVAVLFTNMINQLVDSQMSTLVFVIAATFIMFLLLLRSLRMAVIGLIPNVLAAIMILALMGYAGISLDMMTIMITAIVIGIGVDDAIHYLHRFREEIALGHDARTAVLNSHRSIGSALYFTSLTIVVGFSVLSLSNFIPTISFGVLTAMAMLIALLANLTVLPGLLIKFYK